VKHRDLLPEPGAEPPDGLRSQRYLRDEHDHSPAAGKRRPRGRDVDLGLAGSGHTVEQELAPSPLGLCRDLRDG
jgi:hypothetical protein